MLLWISLAIALVAGAFRPFGSRLHATGLWAGKALVPEEIAQDVAHEMPRGAQDAITAGWPSFVGLVTSVLPLIAAIVGFFHAWWAGLVALVMSIAVATIVGRTNLQPRAVDSYLFILLENVARRRADFLVKGDQLRAEAGEKFLGDLQELTKAYFGSGIPAPTYEIAKRTPLGDRDYLFRVFEGDINDSVAGTPV